MSHFNRLLIIFLVLSLNVIQAHGTRTLIINQANGTSESVTLFDIQKLSFSNHSMTISYIDGLSDVFAVSEINTMTFGSLSTGIKTYNEARTEAQICQNPVKETLIFTVNGLLDESGSLVIMNTEGKVVMQQSFYLSEGKASVNVSSLPTGLYFCRIVTEHKIASLKMLKN